MIGSFSILHASSCLSPDRTNHSQLIKIAFCDPYLLQNLGGYVDDLGIGLLLAQVTLNALTKKSIMEGNPDTHSKY